MSPRKYDVFFKVKPPHQVTAKAWGFWPAEGTDLVWVPKSHAHLDRNGKDCTLYVADWLEAKSKLSLRIAS